MVSVEVESEVLELSASSALEALVELAWVDEALEEVMLLAALAELEREERSVTLEATLEAPELAAETAEEAALETREP